MSGLNCREYEMAVMDLARRRAVDAESRAGLAAHVESCTRCRHLLDSQIRLSAAAGVVADDASRWNAPFRVEQAVVAEARSVKASRRRPYVYGLVGAAVAASLVLVWAMNRTAPKPEVALVVAAPTPVPETAPPKKVEPVAAPDAKKAHPRSRVAPAPAAQAPFIAIPYTMPLEPYEHADVMRVDLPVTALIAAGIEVGAMDPSARVETDVLVGQDGRARAIRPISISMVSYQRPN